MVSDNDLFVIAGATAVAGIAAVYLLWPSSNYPTDDTDGPGPNLVIQVAGETNGIFVIDLDEDVAPAHADRLVEISKAGLYDGVAFHRVIDGFMAQTGDVQNGVLGGDLSMAGTGGSELGDIPAEFSDLPFERGVVGMARAQNPDSANSQFFIMLEPGYFLNGDYTVVGEITEGMDIVDAIKRGTGANGAVIGQPDVMSEVRVTE